MDLPGLGGSGGDAHGTVAAKDALHLNEGTLLILLVGETNETVATRLSGHSVGHDLGRFAGRETSLEQGDQNELVNLRAKIANEDGILRATVIAGPVVSDGGRRDGKTAELTDDRQDHRR